MIKISTTHQPATDLGYLLHKNPGRVHSADVPSGRVWWVFPEASEERCTAVMGVDVDSVALVRGKGYGSGSLGQYVNDRPYVASTFYCTALTKTVATAMSGRCKDKPELAETAMPFEIELPVVKAGLSEQDVVELWEPLGYEVEVERYELDPEFPEWGPGKHYRIRLKGEQKIKDLLNHVYVMLSVLDGDKHYYIDSNEVEKLLRKAAGWIETHPRKNLIVRRYLGRRQSLVTEALSRLADEEPELAEEAVGQPLVDEERPKQPSLHKQRHLAAIAQMKAAGAKSVLDLGCGEGQLLRLLLVESQFKKIVGMDVSYYALERANRRLRMEDMSPSKRERIELIHGSLLYRDKRLEGFDAAAVVEVIEHLDEARLGFFEQVVFVFARPKTVVVTTPNKEYNALYETMAADTMRHDDHRFEWTRAEFEEWCQRVAKEHDYKYVIHGVGDVDETHGAPSQMGVFTR